MDNQSQYPFLTQRQRQPLGGSTYNDHNRGLNTPYKEESKHRSNKSLNCKHVVIGIVGLGILQIIIGIWQSSYLSGPCPKIEERKSIELSENGDIDIKKNDLEINKLKDAIIGKKFFSFWQIIINFV